MFASISSHFAHATLAVVTDLILLLLTGRDACISSLELAAIYETNASLKIGLWYSHGL